MKEYLFNITGFEVPDDFVELAHKFEIQFGNKEKALEKIGAYIGFDFTVNLDEVRGYECVPFEAQLPLNTGGDGEHMGWLDIAPELKDFKKPFVTWAPGTSKIIYHGNTMLKVLEGKVRYMHEHNDYEAVDLDFLNSIGIYPRQGMSIEHSVNYEQDKLYPIPVIPVANWRYEVTMDGTGIYTPVKFFSPEHETLKSILTITKAIAKITELNNHAFYASSIWLTKNTMYRYFYNGSGLFEKLPELYDLAIDAYGGLGRNYISEIIAEHYKFIGE